MLAVPTNSCIRHILKEESQEGMRWIENSLFLTSNHIYFHHDFEYDIYLEHSPLIDPMTFFGTLGGLCGIWIGFAFSVLPNLFGPLFAKLMFTVIKTRKAKAKSLHKNTTCNIPKRFIVFSQIRF